MGIAAYTKTVWASGGVPAIDKDTLDNIENQIAALTAELVKLTTAGDLLHATAAGTFARLALGAAPGARLGPNAAGTAPEWVAAPAADGVAAGETTTSTSFTDLTTPGPAVTLVTGTKAIVIATAQVRNNSVANTYFGIDVSGATTIAADSANAGWKTEPANDKNLRWPLVITFGLGGIAGDLIDGSNTFTMKYRTTVGTGLWGQRELLVIPL